ncbi:MAG: TraR/DksA family transcriptional regulator [Phycisphaeraceae bacterium]
MAKKPSTKKKTTGKPASRKKTAAKKPTAKKSAAKSSKKKAATKKPTKKPTKKRTSKKSAVTKKTTKKSTAKKAPTKKKTTKKKTTKKTAKKKTTKKTTAGKPAAASKKKTTQNKPSAKPKPTKPEDMTLDQLMDMDWTVAKLKRVKTGLKKKDLNYYLQLLLEKRAEIIGNVQGMEDARNAALGDIAHMPLHMADVGSDNYEQEFTLGLMENERELLREIEEAIVRMRDGYYGVCLDSGQPINRARLEAKPWAKYCIEVARIHEKRGW